MCIPKRKENTSTQKLVHDHNSVIHKSQKVETEMSTNVCPIYKDVTGFSENRKMKNTELPV